MRLVANRPVPLEQPAAGDLVVTRIGDQYHVGRAQGGWKPFATIKMMDSLADALALACPLVTGHQRVFLYKHTDDSERVEIDCADYH